MREIKGKNHKFKQSKYKTRIWHVKEISDKKNCKTNKNLKCIFFKHIRNRRSAKETVELKEAFTDNSIMVGKD